MKKLYFLSLILISSLTFGQGNEDFTNTTATASYAGGSFVGNDGITWTFGHSRNEDTFAIDGNGLMLRRASDSYIEATITGGVGNFTFEYRKAFTGASPRQLELLVNGSQVTTTPEFGTVSGEETTVHTFSHDVNVAGDVTIRIKNVGSTTTNKQTIIDNIIWTNFTLSTPNVDQTSFSIYPNPTSTGFVNISSTTTDAMTVAVFDILGKQVINKTISNNRLDVSSLNTGMYIVKISQNNATTTKKLVIK